MVANTEGGGEVNERVLRLTREWTTLARSVEQGNPREGEADARIVDELLALRSANDYAVFEAFVRRVCSDVTPDEERVVSSLGAGPLEELIMTWPGAALEFIEREAEHSATLREALANVWITSQEERIGDILAKYGKESTRT